MLNINRSELYQHRIMLDVIPDNLAPEISLNFLSQFAIRVWIVLILWLVYNI